MAEALNPVDRTKITCSKTGQEWPATINGLSGWSDHADGCPTCIYERPGAWVTNAKFRLMCEWWNTHFGNDTLVPFEPEAGRRSGMKMRPDIEQRIRSEHAQLLELERLAYQGGHGRTALNPDTCEMCRNLRTLREKVARADRLAVAIITGQEIRR